MVVARVASAARATPRLHRYPTTPAAPTSVPWLPALHARRSCTLSMHVMCALQSRNAQRSDVDASALLHGQY
eukprot:7868704-Lingulodinium_polyedra.AAC.1